MAKSVTRETGGPAVDDRVDEDRSTGQLRQSANAADSVSLRAGSPHDFLMLTTGVHGSDGLANLSRLVLRTLARHPGIGSVECWSLQDEPGTHYEGIPIRGAAGLKWELARWALRAGLTRSTRRVLVLHAHLLALVPLLRVKAGGLVPMLVGIEVWKPLSAIQRYAMTKAPYCLSISEHTRQRFLHSNPSFRNLGIRCCHPAVSDRLRSSDVMRGAEPSVETPFALMVARMSASERYKGHDELLEIWSELSRVHPGARLLVVGEGDDRVRLRAKRDRLGLSENVYFLGWVPDDELEELYRRAQLFVMPSCDEGFGLVYVEAMRAGLPVVAGRGAADEIVVDGHTGFVVEPSNRAQLLDRLTRLFTDERLRKSMGAKARHRFEVAFSEQRYYGRLARLLDLPADEAGRD